MSSEQTNVLNLNDISEKLIQLGVLKVGTHVECKYKANDIFNIFAKKRGTFVIDMIDADESTFHVVLEEDKEKFMTISLKNIETIEGMALERVIHAYFKNI